MGHTSNENLQELLGGIQQKIAVGDYYFHWKNPSQIYQVLCIGFYEQNEEPCVIYQQIGDVVALTWVRRLYGEDGWLTQITKDDGVPVDRFQKYTGLIE